jgi:hypothetical protein
MIVTIGKHIRVECGQGSQGSFLIHRSAETPGLITITGRNGSKLKVSPHDVESLCAGLRRAAKEDIGYRSMEHESEKEGG